MCVFGNICRPIDTELLFYIACIDGRGIWIMDAAKKRCTYVVALTCNPTCQNIISPQTHDCHPFELPSAGIRQRTDLNSFARLHVCVTCTTSEMIRISVWILVN